MVDGVKSCWSGIWPSPLLQSWKKQNGCFEGEQGPLRSQVRASLAAVYCRSFIQMYLTWGARMSYPNRCLIPWLGRCKDKLKTGGRWTPEEAAHHINYLEFLAVLLTLKTLCGDCAYSHMQVQYDNTTAVCYIKNMGGSKSPLTVTGSPDKYVTSVYYYYYYLSMFQIFLFFH